MDRDSRQMPSFTCKSDDGELYQVAEFEHLTKRSPLSGRVQWVRGTVDYRLVPSGAGVNKVDEDTFEVVETGILIRRC
jgi:hypothetical protein